MIAAILFSSTILSASPTSIEAPNFADQLEAVETTGDASEVQIVAYNRYGEPIATIAMWQDDGGTVHIEHDYVDGYASIAIVDGDGSTESTLSPETIAERSELVAALVHDTEPLGPRAKSAARIAMAGALCAPLLSANPFIVGAGVIACPHNIIEAWCKCAPLIGLETGADLCD